MPQALAACRGIGPRSDTFSARATTCSAKQPPRSVRPKMQSPTQRVPACADLDHFAAEVEAEHPRLGKLEQVPRGQAIDFR
jgi:hypothetical protein